MIVCGGRSFPNGKLIDRLLTALSPEVLVVGDCKTGADFFAREWAVKRRLNRADYVEMAVYVADWDAAGKAGNRKAAGPIRNLRMCRENRDAAFLLAFQGGSGTADCVTAARKTGIPVLTVGT